jgi:Bifunctional DNA primase/polymerase, N-terminal
MRREPQMRIRHRDAAMLEAALGYAARGWPVAPAVRTLKDAARQATTSTAKITAWWKSHRSAGIVLATGGPVDVLDVPEAVGRRALARLRDTGLPVGPVAAARNRYYFLVEGGGWDRFVVHHERLGAPQLDIAYRGADDAVLLPPSDAGAEPVRWEVEPGWSILAEGKPLPTAAELHGTIAYVALWQDRRT